jgi:excisionase family DNA binding protein
MKFQDRLYVNMREASNLTGLGEYVIRKALKSNQLKAQKMGKRWMIKKEDVVEWANGSNIDKVKEEVENLKSTIEMLHRAIDGKDAQIRRLQSALYDIKQ